LLYLSSLEEDGIEARKRFEAWGAGLKIYLDVDDLRILTREDLPEFVARVGGQLPSLTAGGKAEQTDSTFLRTATSLAALLIFSVKRD
jgi:hypothetical protein